MRQLQISADPPVFPDILYEYCKNGVKNIVSIERHDNRLLIRNIIAQYNTIHYNSSLSTR